MIKNLQLNLRIKRMFDKIMIINGGVEMVNVINQEVTQVEAEALVVGLYEENKENQDVYQSLNDELNHHLDELVKQDDVKTVWSNFESTYIWTS